MKQYRIIIDVNKVDPHKLQEMLNELATIDGVKTDKGMIEYDETLANTTQIREVVDKYLLGSLKIEPIVLVRFGGGTLPHRKDLIEF